MTHENTIKIGVFDSGVGGLTVLREMARLLPDASFVYFGDTARCPYGPKSDTTIIRYSIENSIFLLEQDIDLLVVACHTASALAIDKLKTTFSIPILGMIESTIQKTCTTTRNQTIGVIGTKATIETQIYLKGIHARLQNAEVTQIPCPLFVPLVEEPPANENITRLIIHEYLHPFKEKKIDTLLLGCTHYPLIEQLIQEEMGPDVALVNPAACIAEAVKEIKNSLVQRKNVAQKYTLFVSDDPKRFRKTGERFFGHPLPEVQAVASV